MKINILVKNCNIILKINFDVGVAVIIKRIFKLNLSGKNKIDC